MKQRRYKSTLTRNYAIAAFGMFGIVIISIIFLVFRLNLYSAGTGEEKTPKIEAKDIFTEDYSNMNTQYLESIGGWVEILDDQYKVIFTKGSKKDNITQYDKNDLINSFEKKVNPKGTAYNSVYAFKGKDGRDYLCIVKFPSLSEQVNEALKPHIDLNFNRKDPVDRLIITALAESALLLLFMTILFFILFSKITSKTVTKPLTYIRDGLDRMTKGDLNTRIDFNSHYEFTEIKDSFNYMVERLQNSEREREEAEKSKKRMIMDISHDLKTPITSITGYSKALCEGMVEDEESKKKYLSYIYDKSIRMTKLIEDLFRFSKMEDSEFKLNRQPSDIVEFLREIIASNYGEIEAKEIELDIDLPQEEIIYSFDKIELDRALTNIITNMIKYNPKGTEAFIELVKENSIKIKIGDKGVGMSKDLEASVFDAFVRGESARKTDGGTGLGLAISKKIVELHGGKIHLETEEGKGSIFTIELPL
ncbi:MAG: HAMP domain-containing histidine kinase [Thermodesulfovibrionales bacterium]|nr:HAMP domain-containing histidine kinase [Thermodesulfovibrionales bacterium]